MTSTSEATLAAVSRDRLEQVLLAAYGEAPEATVARVWAGLTEPPYQAGRVYVDAGGEHWYRCSQDDPALCPFVWRNCYTGTLAQEGMPVPPLALTGRLPARDEVVAAVIGQRGMAPMPGDIELTDRIMVLLGQADGDPDA